MSAQSGFTLIELVMTIVILGILVAVAYPKFTDLSTSAENAALESVVGALATGSAVNLALRTYSGAQGVAVADCTDLAGTRAEGLDADYSIAALPIAPGGTATCTVTGPGGGTLTFVGHGVN